MTLQKLLNKTEELNHLLDQVTKSNRLEIIKEINELLNVRDELLKQLDLTSLKEDSILKQLLLDEANIKNKMQEVLNDIRRDIQVVQKKRNSGENYINPYQNLYQDGVFFDKKK